MFQTDSSEGKTRFWAASLRRFRMQQHKSRSLDINAPRPIISEPCCPVHRQGEHCSRACGDSRRPLSLTRTGPSPQRQPPPGHARPRSETMRPGGFHSTERPEIRVLTSRPYVRNCIDSGISTHVSYCAFENRTYYQSIPAAA